MDKHRYSELYAIDVDTLLSYCSKLRWSEKKKDLAIDFFYRNVKPVKYLCDKYVMSEQVLRNYKYLMSKELFLFHLKEQEKLNN